ncbi:CotH kinase family protein [Aporhodopirellula aestuarii]|uniref:CotH kinase family protein n=1 Tax=Aporhodopirellula aestuarii TaxID=2950107 RepID=A0ABT0UG04_9BACT|nr:CotH kinase family protein [Aporhodopirellula aestuarii]MCM2374996.1 CotH kinase family protein [Aporhodopirellula aestuarii]
MLYRASLFVVLLGVAAFATLSLAQPPGMEEQDREILDQFDTDKNGWLNDAEREQAREFVKENPAQRGGPGGGGPGFGGPGGGGPGGGGPGGGGPGGPGFGPPSGFGPPPEFDPSGGPDRFERGERGGRNERGGRGGDRPEGDRGPDRRGGDFDRGGFDRGGEPGRDGGGRRGGGMGGRGQGGNRPPTSPGIEIDKSSVEPLDADLYDPTALRTIFIDFANPDWESELEDFHGTDVDVAATVTVDGVEYPNCGIHFRGKSSYGMVPAGYKRSLNVSMDMADEDQSLLGYKTLNLLNGSSDESMMSTVLYSHIARQYTPAPKANFVRVVINGEYWGVYSNTQQFNKEFLKENYGSSKGARWKVSGSPRGGGGLDYRGDDPANYQYPYEQKSGGKKSLAKLIELCRILDQSPTEELPAALEPIVDMDELLWFLALDNGLINSDGYWIRASDYSIYLDDNDVFHFLPHDMNEAFRAAGGPGGGGPGGGRGGPGGGRGMGGPGMGGPGMGGPGMGGPGMGGPDMRGPERGGPDDVAGRGGRGGMRGPSQGGPPQGGQAMEAGSALELDPLIGLNDASKPLRSKVLAVPKYREQYLSNLRQLADESLDWTKIGPFVQQQASLIDEAVKTETRKLGSYEAFVAATSETHASTENAEPRGGHGAMNLKEFADGRRAYLLKATKK